MRLGLGVTEVRDGEQGRVVRETGKLGGDVGVEEEVEAGPGDTADGEGKVAKSGVGLADDGGFDELGHRRSRILSQNKDLGE